MIATKNAVMVRTRSAGVFAGNQAGKISTAEPYKLKNARRMWYWDGAASLSQLSQEGTSKPATCKFPMEVPEVILGEVIEVIPMTKQAVDSINSVPVWKS